jgi:enoyl-CoA hydratase/carnithine racemase
MPKKPRIWGWSRKLWKVSLRTFFPLEALAEAALSGGRDEVVKEALNLAQVIASKSPVAVYGTKVLISHARDHSVKDNLEYTGAWNAAMLITDVSYSFSAP